MVTFGINRTALHSDVLRPVFEDRNINRSADVVWSPRSCDLTPLDYYYIYRIEYKCYTNKPATIDALNDNIREAIGEKQLEAIDNVLKNWTDRHVNLNEIIFHYQS